MPKFPIIISKLNIQAQKHRIVLVAVSFCFRIVRFILLRSTVKFSFMSNKKCVEQRRSAVLFLSVSTAFSPLIQLTYVFIHFILSFTIRDQQIFFYISWNCFAFCCTSCVCVCDPDLQKTTEKREPKYKQVNKTETPKLFAGRTQTKYDMAQKLLHHFFTYCTCIVRW